MKRRNYISLSIAVTFLLIAFVVNSALAAPPERPNKPTKPPKDTDSGVEWYLRLIAQTPSGDLRDKNNVLGQLFDSVDGYDSNDLRELAPMQEPYLTIVFPQDDWAEYKDNYTSDYHAVKFNEPDQWVFQVMSDDSSRDVDLYWENVQVWQGDISGEELMGQMSLQDLDTGEVITIVENGVSVASYSLNMKDGTVNLEGRPVRTFSWILAGKDEVKGGGKGNNKNK